VGILSTGVETAGEKAYRRLRNDIIFGRLAPSQKLRLEALKEAYGISVSTLRELLNRLTSEGLVVAESARGFEVAPVSADNFRELANLRLLLESHALQRSFVLGDMDWEGRVVAAHHKLATMERRTLAGDKRGLEVLKRYDSEFHQALLSACGSRVLLDAHAAVFDKYIRYLMIAVIFRAAAPPEHQRLLECALKRDAKTAQAILSTHIMDCVNYTLANAPENLLGLHRAAGKRRRPVDLAIATA
jgi:DNA-binding GntR family transcriptional regulator